jgi:hypothetical protein
MSHTGQAFDPRQRFLLGKDKDGKDIEASASDLVWRDRSLRLSPGEKAAYWKLLSFGQTSGEVFIRDETVASEIGIHARHFRSHKTHLKELELIDWHRAEHKRCSQYLFLLHPVLTGNQCAADSTGSTSATGAQYAGGKQPASASGNRSAGVTGTQCAAVKNLSEAREKLSVPNLPVRGTSAEVSFPELPILDRRAFPEFHDPAGIHDATIVNPEYFIGHVDPLAPDIIDFEDPLTRLSLYRRNTLNPFDYPGQVTFNETLFNYDLCYVADAVRDGTFQTLHDGLRAVIEGDYKVESKLWEEIGENALARGLVEVADPVIVPWDEGLDD